MDCVRAAGVDVSDWANWEGGARKASRNPRYCYEWSFIEPGRVVVLNLWFRNMRVSGGRIVQTHNFLQGAREAQKGNWVSRNRKMHRAVTTAWEDSLPVRVIVCDGEMRGRLDPELRASKVTARVLDPEPWAVTSLDTESGAVELGRGTSPRRRSPTPTAAQTLFPDEAALPTSYPEGARKAVTVNGIERDPRARRECIRYFGLRCQVCDLLFTERYGPLGQNFIHVHHIKPLGGTALPRRTDPTKDLVPVCPNCHAMLHQRTPPMSLAALRKQLLADA
jgi:hypothetical protein